jgi:poly(hydroxyalkanoate) depolymerase family esterase
MPPNMAEALALVRAGRLQEASDLLMGTSSVDASVKAAAPLQSSPGEGLSDLAARGLAGMHDVLSKLNLRAGNLSATPPRATPAQTTSEHRSDPSTQSVGEPGRFDPVTFTHNGASHPYFLYTPKAAAPSGGRPLVLMLHGCTQDAQDFARGTRMNATAESAGALVLYPSQTQSANAKGCWNWFRPEDQQAGAGEPALLLAMVRHAMAAQAVDSQRVYVAGLSAGGAMAAVLAQQYPDVFAAVGVHSGLPPGSATNMMGALSAMKSGAKGWRAPLAKEGAPVVPMIVLHGASDTTVHQRNAEQLLQGAAAGIATTVQTQEQGQTTDGQRYTRTCVVDPAAAGEIVAEHWLLHGAGHAWSGGDSRGSHASPRGVNASGEMLRFFLTQAKGVDIRANDRPRD